MRAIVAEHQVGPPAVEQQVGRLEGQGEGLDALTEVKGVPQVVVGGIHEEILRNKTGTQLGRNGKKKLSKSVTGFIKSKSVGVFQ